jgi:hypothetical protein
MRAELPNLIGVLVVTSVLCSEMRRRLWFEPITGAFVLPERMLWPVPLRPWGVPLEHGASSVPLGNGSGCQLGDRNQG